MLRCILSWLAGFCLCCLKKACTSLLMILFKIKKSGFFHHENNIIWVYSLALSFTWVKVFRIIPVFRILRLTFHWKSASTFWISQIILFAVYINTIDHFAGILQVFRFKFLKFMIFEILNFHPCLQTVALGTHTAHFDWETNQVQCGSFITLYLRSIGWTTRALTRILKTGVRELFFAKKWESHHTKEHSLFQKIGHPVPKMGVQDCKSAVSESSGPHYKWVVF